LALAELNALTSLQASANTWYGNIDTWLAQAGQIAAALVAAGAVLAFTWGTYRRTFGRRRDRYGRLARLGTNAQITFFSSVLGEPPAIRRTQESTISTYDSSGTRSRKNKTWTECIWIDRDFYVQAFADEDETIHAYSVTTRSRHFSPGFRAPGAHAVEHGRIGHLLRLPSIKLQPKIRLGKTHFGAIDNPQNAGAWIGAHNMHYFESHYYGNPGFYQTFVFSINDSGYGAYDHLDQRLNRFWLGFSNDGQASLPKEDSLIPAWYDAFRKKARMNTYTVMTLSLEDYPLFTPPPEIYQTSFGPRSVITRTIITTKRKPRLARWPRPS